jgi:hypothetical protein|tara:strand:- start:1115 stop:1300 length:186 start_codon:yes stop_codon:yes gene_type:complete
MKIKVKLNKIHSVNPNGILCDTASFDKLKEGKEVDIPGDAAKELINMGMVEQLIKKGVKDG